MTFTGASAKHWGSPIFWVVSLATSFLVLLLSPDTQFVLIAPTYAALYVYFAFTYILHLRVGNNLFGEIGFLYLTLIIAYTVLPAFTFIAVDFEVAPGWVWEMLSLLLPDPKELGAHLWRHVLFIFGVALGYLMLRKPDPRTTAAPNAPPPDQPLVLAALAIMILGSVSTLSLLSAPVNSYIDHYTRYDHLSWVTLRLVYLLFMFKSSAYYILLTLLFLQYQRYKVVIAVVVLIIATYETVYSFGSRIETLSILLCTACLYHYNVRRISLKKGFLSFLAIAALFSVVELFRSLDFDLVNARDMVATEGASPASEFGAVFFTGFHLYSERAQGSLPPTEPLMFFSDLLAFVPFIEREQWLPQYWYARNYFPDAAVPPQTNGPIADSAVWGGEIDLLLRSVLNGAIYAWLMQWFLRRRNRWWACVIYAYCYATCVMTLKYSVFYQLTPLVRIILPGILLTWIILRIFRRPRA